MNRPLFISISIVAFIGCSLFEDDGPKDPRDYTWTIDTLKHPYPDNYQLGLQRMWASSSDDIYIVGHSYRVFGTMWHFNGNAWSVVPLDKRDGGFIETNNHSINDIFGFSKDDIWAVGRQSGKRGIHDAFVIHYDGWKWTEITPPDTTELMSIGGGDNGKIWVGPYGGGIFMYNGTEWIEEKINFTEPSNKHSYNDNFVSHQSHSTYAIFTNISDAFSNGSDILLKRKDNQWEEIYIEYSLSRPWVSEKGAVYTQDYEVKKFVNDIPEKAGETPKGFGVSQFYGIKEDFIFACGRFLDGNFGNVLFYNGKKWITLLEDSFEGVFFNDIWSDGRTVIAIGNIYNPNLNTIVLRGE